MDLEILKAAKETAVDRVQKDPSKANLESLEKASKMIDDFMKGEQEPSFSNRKEVLLYLNRQGYAVKKTKLYDDCKKGLLRLEADKSVLESSIKSYIRKAGLEKPTEKAADDRTDLMTQRAEAELQKVQGQVREMEFKRGILEGEYVRKTDFELELASRAAVLDTGIRHMIHSNIAEWVDMVGGDSTRIPAILEKINDDLDNKFDEFASMKNFHVIFLDK